MTGRDFYQYEVCPRGAGNEQDHVVQDLFHIWYEGRQVCMAGEAVEQLRAARKAYAAGKRG